uniref:Uncharacterized protein n=1 Tax=Solanum tuberosum TaxID=4113 RepID=M1DWM6_SOLTU
MVKIRVRIGGKRIKISMGQGTISKFEIQILSPFRINTLFLQIQPIPEEERQNRHLRSIPISLRCYVERSHIVKDENAFLVARNGLLEQYWTALRRERRRKRRKGHWDCTLYVGLYRSGLEIIGLLENKRELGLELNGPIFGSLRIGS